MSRAFVKVPGTVWLILIAGVCLGWLSPNPALTSASLLILPILVFPLWLKGAPPALSFILFYQWLEVTLKVFSADLAGITVLGLVRMGTEENPMFVYSREIEKAIWLALGGLLFLAIGMRLGIAGMSRNYEKKIQFDQNQLVSTRKLFVFYVITLITSTLCNYMAFRLFQFSQIFVVLAKVKWIPFFLLVYSILQRKREHGFLIIVFLLEIATGFLGYFAQFKDTFFVLTIVFLTLNFRFRAKHTFIMSIILLMGLLLSSAWTVVKSDYRVFLDEAAVQSKGSISLEARIEKMASLVGELNGEKLKKGARILMERISYVDFFAHVLETVPQLVPHEHGLLLKKALIHVTTPRLLFPDKPSLEPDSDVTRRYTRIMVAGGEKGGSTSIGIGYFAESYVDFGIPGMFFSIFLVGLLQGSIYQYFILRTKTRMFGYAVATTALLFSGALIETSLAKVLGGTVMSFVILAIFSKIFERQFVKHTVATVV